jgi:WD40 repeat protein
LIAWDTHDGKVLSCEMADVGEPLNRPDYLRFTPDGRFCLTIHPDAVVVWEIASGLPVHVLRESDQISGVDLAPDGRSLLVVLAGGRATMWDVEAGAKARAFGERQNFGGAEPSAFWGGNAKFSADGRRIISISHGGRGVHQADAQTGEQLGSFYLLGDGCDAVAFMPDGRLAATSPGLVRDRKAGSNTLLPAGDAH